MTQDKTNQGKFQVMSVRSRTAQLKKDSPDLDIDKFIATLVMVVPTKPILGYPVNEPCLIVRLNNRALKIDGSFGPCLTNADKVLRYATEDEISLFFNGLDSGAAIDTLFNDIHTLLLTRCN